MLIVYLVKFKVHETITGKVSVMFIFHGYMVFYFKFILYHPGLDGPDFMV